MSGDLWVFVEQQKGEMLESSLELVCEGRKLADVLKGRLSVILFGYEIGDAVQTLSRYGADAVFLSDDAVFEKYQPGIFTGTLVGLVRLHDPDILLLSATIVGQDLAPRVAGKLRTNLVPNCDRFGISDDGLLLQTRLTHQNKLHTSVICPGARPQIATLLPGSTKKREAKGQEKMEIIEVDHTQHLVQGPGEIEITGFIKADPATIDIADAELIVSGGKGVGDKESFQLIEELAVAVGASVAGSRVAVDNGWIGRERQIGQSGQSVSPYLMLSFGISGASAHTFGMRDTKTLIAVNKDKAAPLMKMADLGVVGDLHEILPELIERIRSINAGETERG